MVTAQEVRDWVNGAIYANLVKDVSEGLGLAVNDSGVPEVVLQHDANKLNFANLHPVDLASIARETVLVSDYVAAKLNGLRDEAEEQEGKIPDDEDDVIVETHAFYLNFLNIYLIELHFLRCNPGGLLDYLKGIRVPGSKKYAAQIMKIYKTIAC
ncbi:hypothetical protein QEL93_004268 [Pseudomonas putida]|nr:hypothetical protein [Pseudomonas putida]